MHSEPSEIFVGSPSEGKIIFADWVTGMPEILRVNVPVSKNLRRKWSEMMPYNFLPLSDAIYFQRLRSSAAESNSFKCPCCYGGLSQTPHNIAQNRSLGPVVTVGCAPKLFDASSGVSSAISLNSSSVPGPRRRARASNFFINILRLDKSNDFKTTLWKFCLPISSKYVILSGFVSNILFRNIDQVCLAHIR